MENMNYKLPPADINKATIRDLSVTNQAEELKQTQKIGQLCAEWKP